MGIPNSLFAAVVEVTNRCNFRCPFCASDSGCARENEMSLDEMRGVVQDLASLGCREFTMLGGEFLLRPDWYEIGRAVKDAGMELQLITNGLLVTEEHRRQFKTLDPQTVCVSLDGATPESYRAARGVDGFAKCRKLLDDLVADGFREVHAITTFNAKNLGDFDAFVAMFTDSPIVWQVQMAHKGGERFPNDPNSFAQFRRKEEHLTGACAKCPFGSRCKAGCSAMAISQTGTLTETPFCIRQLETERIIKEMTE